jgi:putative endonuclease
MGAKQRLGKWGEDTAAAWLTTQGYRILDRNVRFRHGEIDVVARIEDTLVFVEVKTRHSTRLGRPQEAVGGLKQHRLRLLALRYLQSRCLSQESRCRFDVIAIQPSGAESPLVEHFVNAF